MGILDSIRKPVTTVGLDIGNHSIKLVKIRHGKDGPFLEATGVQELPSGTIDGSEIKEKEVLSDAIRTVVDQCDPSIIEVVISMSGHGIITDTCTFTIDPNENAEEFILWEAGQRSPFDVDDITLDYRILHRETGTNQVEVLLVAAKNRIMYEYLDLLYDTGLKPIIVDVDAFALNNAYSLEVDAAMETGVVMLLNIGHDLTNVTFVKDGVYHSTRDISTAGGFFAKTIQRNLGIGTDEAIALLKGRSQVETDPAAVTQAIEYAAEELSSGIDLAFSYLRSSEKIETIERIVISGGGAYIHNIIPLLQQRHDVTVRPANPLAHLKYNPDLFQATNPSKISALLTVAIGLALRQVSE